MEERGTPPIETLPVYPLFLPIRIEASVDLPQPLSPTSAVKLPCGKVRSTLWRISRSGS